jgi:hypothetical protein
MRLTYAVRRYDLRVTAGYRRTDVASQHNVRNASGIKFNGGEVEQRPDALCESYPSIVTMCPGPPSRHVFRLSKNVPIPRREQTNAYGNGCR